MIIDESCAKIRTPEEFFSDPYECPVLYGQIYPAWSPYNYVLNNSLGMVDPDGKEICLVYDNKSKSCTQQYKAGMDAEQFKDNKDLYNFVLGLNKLSTIDVGATVIATLIKSQERYIFSDQRSPQGAYAFGGTTRTFYMGGFGSEEMDIDDMVRVGHELFHAYQKDKLGSEFGSGIDIEVEGYLFQYIIRYGLDNYRPDPNDYIGGNDVPKGEEYSKGMISMAINYLDRKEFPIRDFRKAADNFKEGSDTMGAYKDFPIYTYTKKQTPVIASLYHTKVKQ
ncbi:MAG: hypothetical protein JNN12_02315 [Bacteroidetes Order II. Incertae sedis bacterium]|nr:hypothetical protein [Bacteroidetes Order II. bacterium]